MPARPCRTEYWASCAGNIAETLFKIVQFNTTFEEIGDLGGVDLRAWHASTKLNVRLGGNGEHGGEGGVGEAPTFHANVVHFENMNGPSAILVGTEQPACHCAVEALLKPEGKGVDEIEADFDAVEEARPHHDIRMKDIGTLRGMKQSPEAQEFSVGLCSLTVSIRVMHTIDGTMRVSGEPTADLVRFLHDLLNVRGLQLHF
ncbi:hypothetical protein B0H13DRAFT_2261402 [Mycena leptocephala]|nr:hypothetical protein B0H13DRAFT_2261402 [Mycena leptocephala]